MSETEYNDLREDFNDLKIEVKTLIKLTEQRLTLGDKTFDDHEKRLRFLERYAFILVGVIGVASTILSYLK